jgi:16S rRNA (cytidine1402-2'-O)-methyltransferase
MICDALRGRYADRQFGRHHIARARGTEISRPGRSRRHTAFRAVDETFRNQKTIHQLSRTQRSKRTAEFVERLARGENIALITDAGTPGLSDPGLRLVRECIQRELSFSIIPGPSSILTALVGSGFSTEKFSFRGFLPVKTGRRERELRAAAESRETIIFFESPYRLTKTLAACIDVMPDRQLCIARELTKKFEEFRRGTARELLAHYEARPPKGEIVLVISAP